MRKTKPFISLSLAFTLFISCYTHISASEETYRNSIDQVDAGSAHNGAYQKDLVNMVSIARLCILR